jgi:ATP-binding cassette subfamily F protein 3
MIAIHLDHIAVNFAGREIFASLDWEIHDDRCVGLVGPNGAGKSTLLKIIAGELVQDGGNVFRAKGLTIGYLPQELALSPDRTAWEEALTASEHITRLEQELARVEAKLGDPAVYGDEKALTRTLDAQARLLHEYEVAGGPGYETRVRETLHSLGFSDNDMSLETTALSGGQKKLVGLCKLLVTRPALLLLDEPDNHLDLEAKAALEKTIVNYEGAVVIVSHDRYLLDAVADEIADLEDGKIKVYLGNYSEYAFEKRTALLQQQQRYSIQQREIKRIETAGKRVLQWGRQYDNPKLVRRGKAILARLDKIERIERPVLERRKMGLELNGWRGSNKVLEIEGLEKSFGENCILRRINLLVRHGERVGLVGPNGAGKSLLLRMILGQDEPTAGEIIVGPSVRVGYYAQQHETLDYAQTLMDTVRRAAPMTEGNAVAFLGKFLFGYRQTTQKIESLSGGEHSRVQLALLMLSGANFLLLDEPTNNLDIASAEVLEDELDEFEGTVLAVSHDRYFLDRVATRIVELDEGTLTEYIGGWSDYASSVLPPSPVGAERLTGEGSGMGVISPARQAARR